MPKYTYVALDAKGKESRGEIEADNQNAAVSRIREKGLFPTGIAEGETGHAPRKASAAASAAGGMQKRFRFPVLFGGVKTKILAGWTRQLATLVDAGLPLLRGLRVLTRQEHNAALKRAVNEMAESIESGSTFAEALAQHPKIFNKLFVNMVRAGEIGGVLDTVLMRLADFMEKAQRIKNKIVSAMVYPSVVMVMALAILTLLMVYIIPKFQDIFNELLEGKPMPGLTMFVLGVSKAMTTRLPFIIASVIGLVIVIKVLGRTSFGRFGLDQLKLHAPVFGALVRKTAIARFTRTLGTLLTSGVPVLQALNIVKETIGNEVVARAVTVIHDSVKEGENMAPPIEASRVFPPMVVSMVEVGEETGELPEMLMKVADAYDDEVDNAVGALTSIIEPLLIVFLAIVVGSIVIALFLPLVSIIGSMSS